MAKEKMGVVGKSWIILVFVYSVFQAFVVKSTVAQYGVNTWVFLFISLLTAYPYAYGQVKLVQSIRAKALRNAQKWTLIIGVSFLAPYAYIAYAGASMPIVVWVVLAIIVAVFGISAVTQIKRKAETVSPESI